MILQGLTDGNFLHSCITWELIKKFNTLLYCLHYPFLTIYHVSKKADNFHILDIFVVHLDLRPQ